MLRKSHLNYRIGKTWRDVRDWTLRKRPPVIWTRYPRGSVFPLDLLRFADKEPIRLILDIGANDGGTADELATWIPSATIHSFEPVDGTFQQLKKRTRHLASVHVHPFACGARRDRVQIQLKGHSTINTLVGSVSVNSMNEPPATESLPTIALIDVITVDEFCKDHGIEVIDLLKTDTEGFDLEVLRGAESLLSQNKVRFVYSEVGFGGQSTQTDFCKMSAYLLNHGFHLAGFYEPMRFGARKEKLMFCNALFAKHK